MSAFDVRLVAYEPNGARLGLLPTPLDVQASFPLNDASALSIKYSTLAAGGSLLERGLEQGLEVAVEVPGDSGWVEPANARFMLLKRTSDASDVTGALSLTLPGYAWLLRKARNLETANLLPDDHSEAGKRPFYSANAGTILATLLQENSARGGVSLGRDFTTATDSAGNPWANVITIFYDLGLDLWTILDNLTLQGLVDWQVQGRTLRVFNADTVLARDLSTGNTPIRLHMGRDVTEAPEEESLEDVIGRVLIRGDKGLVFTENNPAAPSPWGTWEGYISQGGVSDEGTARTLVQVDLERGSRVRGQYTRGLTFAAARVLPLADYGPGDYVLAPTAGGRMERVRVQQVTLTRGSDGVAGNVVLNDRVIEAELRRARRVNGIVGGSSSDGGSGARPSPEGPDKRTPAAPLGLVVASEAYLDPDGAARGQITAVWAPVSTATDGTALEVASYELWGRLDVAGASWRRLTSSTGTESSWSPLDVGTTWLFRVRARGRYATSPGAWSASVQTLIATDTTPPPVPMFRQQDVTTWLRTVTVRWSGTAASGGGMPIDFRRCHVYQSSASNMTNAVRVGSIEAAHDSWQSGTMPASERVWFALTAVDRSGNESAMSAAFSITPTANVDVSEIADRIDAAAVEITVSGQELSQRLNNAFQVGQDAATVADSAASTAADAQSTADQAIGTASAAEQAALDAAGLAGSKGEVIYQASVPTGARANAANLWIRTSDNRPHTYNGTAWIAVTDKAATDAASAAATAATAAATAQARADAAHALAGTANTTAQQAITSASGKNTVFRSTSAASGTGTRVGDIWMRFSDSTYSTVTGQWTWSGTGWQPNGLSHQVISSVDVGSLTVAGTAAMDTAVINQLWADVVRSRRITTDMLLVGSGSNLIVDPEFLDEGLRNTRMSRTPANVTIVSNATDFPGAPYAFRLSESASTQTIYFGSGDPDSSSIYGSLTPVKPGDRVIFRVYATGAASMRFRFSYVANLADGSNAHRTVPGSTWTPTNSRWVEQAWTIPEDVATVGMNVQVQGGVGTTWAQFQQPYFAFQVESSLIVDGGILARHISALAVTTDKLAANAVTADKADIGSLRAGILTANSVNATMIAANAITAKHTITGALVQTTAAANRGVKIDTNGLRAYNASGQQTLTINASTGAVTMLGDLTSGSTVTGATIIGSTVSTAPSGARMRLGWVENEPTRPGIWMYDASNTTRYTTQIGAAAYPQTWYRYASGQGALTLSENGASWYTTSGDEGVRISAQNPGGVPIGWIYGPVTAGVRGSLFLGRQAVDGTDTQVAGMTIIGGGSDSSSARVTNGGAWHIGGPRGEVTLDNRTGAFIIAAQSGLYNWWNLPATSSTGNPLTMIISEAGYPSIYRQTSVRASKVDITDVTADPELVLDVPVREWFDKTAYDRRENAQIQAENFGGLDALTFEEQARATKPELPRIPGVVAEELEEAGLGQFCSYDERGELVGVMYDRLGLLLIPVVRDLRDRITQLEEGQSHGT